MKYCWFAMIVAIACAFAAPGIRSLTAAPAETDLLAHPACEYCGMDRTKFAHSRVYISYDDGTTAGTDLVRGMLARRRGGKLKGGPAGPGGQLTSFAEGMESLPRALAARRSFAVEPHACAAGVGLDYLPDGGWTLFALHRDAQRLRPLREHAVDPRE